MPNVPVVVKPIAPAIPVPEVPPLPIKPDPIIGKLEAEIEQPLPGLIREQDGVANQERVQV